LKLIYLLPLALAFPAFAQPPEKPNGQIAAEEKLGEEVRQSLDYRTAVLNQGQIIAGLSKQAADLKARVTELEAARPNAPLPRPAPPSATKAE
jgi:hypothetical protein